MIYGYLNAYQAYGDENPNGWFVGANGRTFIDYTNNDIYKWISGTTWKKISTFDGDYNSLLNRPVLFSGKYSDLTEKPALFSGNYTDLINKPVLFNGDYNSLLNKPVLFNGDYNSLLNKPSLFSGNYADLINKPSIPDAQVNSDWNATTGKAQILNKPSLITKLDFSAPIARNLSKSIPYQATDPNKAAIISLSLGATSSTTLTGNSPNAGYICIGTNASQVALGNGSIIGRYNNSQNTGLTVTLAQNNSQTNGYIIHLPIGYYFAIIQSTGTGLTIENVVEQVVNLV